MAKTWATKCCSGTYKNNYQLCCGIKDRYDGMRDLINNTDEDVDCITSATESSIYHNDSFYIFV